MYGDNQKNWKNPDEPANDCGEGTFPEARAAIVAAFRRKLGLVEPTE